jgi:DUF1365 family protein
MNSSLYKARVMHNRTEPKVHRFHYNVFMFYVDLDELDELAEKHLMFSRNKWNFFSFRDREHLQLPVSNPDQSKNTKQHLLEYLAQNGIHNIDGRIMLLTNMNVLGYNFNPVSFYICYDKANQPVCSVVEVSNTYREMKTYLITDFVDGKYTLNTKKYFYVSPFIDHDAHFEFGVEIPGEKLNIRIDDIKEGRRFFISTLTGKQKAFSGANLLLYFLRFPIIPLQIMFLIHWNALLLWFKKIPYHKKGAHGNLQRDVMRKYQDK